MNKDEEKREEFQQEDYKNKGKDINKKYFKISEVSEILGETYATLRLWEKEFGFHIHTVRGTRYYKYDDIDKLKNIQSLRRKSGYSIKGAKVKLDNDYKAVNKRRNIAERLTAIRSELVAIRKELNTQSFSESIIVD